MTRPTEQRITTPVGAPRPEDRAELIVLALSEDGLGVCGLDGECY
jgi:hypothetical protein